MSPSTGSYAVVCACVWVFEHVRVHHYHKISRKQNKSHRHQRDPGGKMICFQSWWTTFLSPTSSPVMPHSNVPHPYISTATRPLGGTCGKVLYYVSMSSHANQTSLLWDWHVWCADQLFIRGFRCLGFGALTHCFPPQSDGLCLQSEAMREQSNGMLGNMLNHQREWWGASEGEGWAEMETRPQRRWDRVSVRKTVSEWERGREILVTKTWQQLSLLSKPIFRNIFLFGSLSNCWSVLLTSC